MAPFPPKYANHIKPKTSKVSPRPRLRDMDLIVPDPVQHEITVYQATDGSRHDARWAAVQASMKHSLTRLIERERMADDLDFGSESELVDFLMGSKQALIAILQGPYDAVAVSMAFEQFMERKDGPDWMKMTESRRIADFKAFEAGAKYAHAVQVKEQPKTLADEIAEGDDGDPL
jgi:hypothetical protein